MWPENESAQAGLDRCLGRLIDRSLEARDLGAAESLLDELGEQTDYPDKISKLRADLDQERAQVAQLKDLAEHHDVEMDQQRRGRQLLGMSAAVAVIGTALAIGIEAFDFQLAYDLVIGLAILPLPIVATVGWWGHARNSPVSRRLIVAFALMCAATLFIRVIGWRTETPTPCHGDVRARGRQRRYPRHVTARRSAPAQARTLLHGLCRPDAGCARAQPDAAHRRPHRGADVGRTHLGPPPALAKLLLLGSLEDLELHAAIRRAAFLGVVGGERLL